MKHELTCIRIRLYIVVIVINYNNFAGEVIYEEIFFWKLNYKQHTPVKNGAITFLLTDT